MQNSPPQSRIKFGWREWFALPDLGLPAIKAKIDTGAKTSALHAFEIECCSKNGKDFVRFKIHPVQNNNQLVVNCEAPLLDQRMVSDSGGHSETRYVIQTRLIYGEYQRLIELTLTNRDSMRFRMLLGRRAMQGVAMVDPDASYLCGKLNYKRLYKLS